MKLSQKEALTLRTNIAKKAAAHKAEPMLQRKPDFDMPRRHTAGDSKVAKPIKNAPVDFSRARWTRDTKDRPNARWQALELAPDPRYPSFASAPPGVDPDTGKAWGAAA